jgi:hypothetical protein
MKRLIITLFIVIVVVLSLGMVLWWQLPSVVTFLLGRAIGGRIEAVQSRVSWNGGIATMELDDVALSGDVQGTIKRARLDVRLGRGIYIKYGSVSDFDVIIKKEKHAGRFLPFQIEYAEVIRGRAVYKGQTVTINSIKISNFNTTGRFEFSLDGGIEGFGKIKTHGGGIWRDQRSDVSGTYEIVDFDLSRLFRRYEGHGDSKGQITYRNGEWGMHGAAGADRFVLKENFLRKPVEVQRVDCRIDIETSGGKIHTKLNRLSFKGIPLHLAFTNNGRRLMGLEMTSGPLDVDDIKEYINLSFLKRLPTVMDAISGGKVTIRELVYAKPDTFKALFSLKDIDAHYKEFRFTGLSGGLRLDRDKMVLSGLRANSMNSLFSDVSGTVPFSEKKEFWVSGKYQLDLSDARHSAGNLPIRIGSGWTEGVVEFRGKREDDIRVEGVGRLNQAVFSWKNLLMTASGSYVFDRNGINCSPIIIKKDGTQLQVQGRLERDSTALQVEGTVNGADLAHLCSFPYPLGGSAGVNGRLEGRNGHLAWQGAANMDALSFYVPGFMAKEVGVPSSVTFQLRQAANGGLYVEDLRYVLDTATIQGEGKIGRNKIASFRVKVDVPDLGRLSDSIAAKGIKTKGEVKADVAFHDLRYPLDGLPRLTGYMIVKNGYLALPSLAKPIENLDAVCDFAGNHYEMKMTNLRTGASAIEKAILIVEGDDRPRLALRLSASMLNVDDIFPDTGKPWRISAIRQDSVVSQMSGEILLQVKQAQWGRISLKNLDTKLNFADRKLILNDGNAGVFGGTARATGVIDLAALKPRLGLTGSIERISWDDMFKALKDDAEIMKGVGMLKIDLLSEGENKRETIESLSGRITANSNDGVIRKWNLLSKVFGLLNLYDLLQGKVNLAEEGLPYTAMSADFTGKKGVFKTRNFSIDSPSMYISGRGAVMLPDGTLDGRLAVSPFVTIDKLLDKIPIVRSVLREKKEGFLFVVYNVSGPFRDPNIYSTYVESVGMRAYRILKNLVKLPREVVR